MPTIFVKKSDRVSVIVYAYEQDGKTEAVSDKNEVPNNAEDVQELEFIFRRPNYSDSYGILQASGMNSVEMTGDVNSFADHALRTLLVDWNITDGDDKILFTKNAINKLHPAIARAAAGGALEKMGI